MICFYGIWLVFGSYDRYVWLVSHEPFCISGLQKAHLSGLE